ncbi:hypothetical protein ABZY44_12835 [Streptomyces sp. NPDC006544]|uniref:hypothetical protein n=1 Tax=Streptomyces sp. NPDC006544 TaxID=3154583 RepID=UPI0033B70255
MADNAGPMAEATLYEAPHYAGNAVTLRPDTGDQGGGAVAYALAHLGLSRLGSLRAPSLPADPDDLFRQELRWVTTVTVWRSRPDSFRGERGRTWQDYSADTADLGAWATKAAYVRVWEHTAGGPADAGPLRHDGAGITIAIVE